MAQGAFPGAAFDIRPRPYPLSPPQAIHAFLERTANIGSTPLPPASYQSPRVGAFHTETAVSETITIIRRVAEAANGDLGADFRAGLSVGLAEAERQQPGFLQGLRREALADHRIRDVDRQGRLRGSGPSPGSSDPRRSGHSKI